MTDLPSPPSRRSQAERSAGTRERLIAAAIACLHRTGYGATTVTAVADAARVSRGAMTHQFPAKTDLMLAVVRAVFEDDVRLYAEAVAAMDPAVWPLRHPELMWAVMSRPAGIAVMEIMLASRADPELAERLRALQTRIDAAAHDWSRARLRAAGLPPHPEEEAIHELYVAAVRGLALQATYRGDAAGVHRALRLLVAMIRGFYPALDDPKRFASAPPA